MTTAPGLPRHWNLQPGAAYTSPSRLNSSRSVGRVDIISSVLMGIPLRTPARHRFV